MPVQENRQGEAEDNGAQKEQGREGNRVSQVAEEAIRGNGGKEPLVVVQTDESEVGFQGIPLGKRSEAGKPDEAVHEDDDQDD